MKFAALYAVGLLAIGSLPAWTDASSTFTAFILGVFVGFIPFVGYMILVANGMAARLFGADAETWTAEELAKLDQRVWRIFHDVPLRWGNVDHVAVGPGRVYAIETKWTSSRGAYRDGPVRQAQRQAELLQHELRARGVERTVIPLLVIWGPGVADTLDNGPKLEGQTRVVAGANAEDWRRRMVKAADRLEIDWPAANAIEALISGPQADRVG